MVESNHIAHEQASAPSNQARPSKKPLLLGLGFLCIAVAISAALIANKKPPATLEQAETRSARPATYIDITPGNVRPNIQGFGVVQSNNKHRSIAEVSGTIVEISPELKSGKYVTQGTLLAEIDPQDIALTEQQAKASLNAAQAKYQELKVRIDCLKAQRSFLEQRLEFAQEELNRKSVLKKNGAISASMLDAEQQKVLQLQQEQSNLDRELASMPTQLAAADSQVKSAQSSLKLQSRQRTKTRIVMPFDGTITKVLIDAQQFVASGTVLFEANGTESTQIETHIAADHLQHFLRLSKRGNPSQAPHTFLSVRVTHMDHSWNAKVLSISDQVDSKTQTLAILLQLDPEKQATEESSISTPLPGSTVRNTIYGPPINTVAIPRELVMLNEVLLADANDQLLRQAIKPLFSMEGWILLDPEAPLDTHKLITSHVIPAVEGTQLSLVPDTELQLKLDMLYRTDPLQSDQHGSGS